MKTNRNQLENLLAEIAELSNLSTTKEQAIANGQDKYLYLEYASVYGGYRVVSVGIHNGAHYGALGESSSVERRKASEMYNFLDGVKYGIEYNTRLNQSM